MSSNIPTRRVTRATRTTTALKDKENAVTRPLRNATRAKPPSTTATIDAKPVAHHRAAASTAATRAKNSVATAATKQDLAQGKRKREALGEVAGPADINTKGKATETCIPEGKAHPAKPKFDGVVLKKTTATTTATVRPPLRTVVAPRPTATTKPPSTTRRTRSTTVAAQTHLPPVHESRTVHIHRDDDAMVVDPVVVPVPSPRRFTAARAAAANRTVASSRTQASTRVRRQVAKIEEDEAEMGRVHKKRRTSSDIPEESEAVQEQEVESALQFDEADPNGDQWDDLDADDIEDPLMVSEYVVEIFEYLKEVEQTTMPNPTYMENQKDLAWKMRGILTDWLIQVHSRFRLAHETLFLCVNIIDRFLSARVVSLAKLQLVGITCMFIAAKVEEIVAPSAQNFLFCADSSYTEAEILQAERYVLKTIDWNLNYPNPMHFLRRTSKADSYNVQVRTIGKYLLEIQCLEWRLIAAPPSLMAAAAIWLARLILGFADWTPNLAHYSSYSESALIPTASLMLNYIIKPIRHQSFYKKYASKKFLKASVFVREWALERWEEGAQISLQDELPQLKALIREAREREELALAEAEAEGLLFEEAR